MRRREDVYLGFCIAALVGCCEDCGSEDSNATHLSSGSSTPAATVASFSSSSITSSSSLNACAPLSGGCKRASYVTQLQAVVLGKGAKSQRRLTTRSRLRAAFALQLILATASNSTSNSSVMVSGSSSDNLIGPNSFFQLAPLISKELPQVVPFLYCLAELQETRLSCSEEALMDSLTCLPSTTQPYSQGEIGRHARTDARLLVRTWLHDEGYHREVRNRPICAFQVCLLTPVKGPFTFLLVFILT